MEMQSSTAQRRRFKRVPLYYYVPVHDRVTGEAVGRVVDLTPSGMRLVGDRPFEVDRNCSYELRLESLLGEPVTIEVETCAVWAGRDVNPDLYAGGFRVTRSSAPEGMSLEQLIARVGFDQDDPVYV